MKVWFVRRLSEILNSEFGRASCFSHIYEEYGDPNEERQNGGEGGESHTPSCINAIVSLAFEGDVRMNVVHEIEYGRTTQTSLDGLHQLTRHLHVLDELVAILKARLPHTVHVNDGMNQSVQNHNTGSNRRRDPVMWGDVILCSSL